MASDSPMLCKNSEPGVWVGLEDASGGEDGEEG